MAREAEATRVQPVEAGAARRAALDEAAQRAARSSCTILLSGQTGVGKGYLARRLHEHSRRQDGPFIPVNCGAIPETLIDSQLFGHVRGAFSGATADHIGLVRAAEGGTLFLDEVGELPLSAQTRLLRLLQEREVQPVGHVRPVPVDVRIIAATNGDLHDLVRRRLFREDLLFRLDVIRLHVRPLRERWEELLTLLDDFNREFARTYGQAPLEFDDRAIERLRRYSWPGNIRELRTVVERLHVLHPEERVTSARLDEIGLDAETLNAKPAGPFRVVENARTAELMRILRDTGGSVARTAAIFGVHRSTIYRWLERHRRGDDEGDD